MRALALALLVGCSPSSSSSAPAASPAPPAAASEASAVADIDVQTLKERLPTLPVLVDVRTEKEFVSGHVPGAVNIPLQSLGSRMAELEPYKGGPVHLICRSGGRSARAAGQLAEAGFTPVNVLGGTLAWQKAGYATE